jgi:ubiquinone/menaquinone biosynthesis C-methylase UbiE
MNLEEEITTTAFDSVASSYDTDFTFSNIGKYQRKRIYHFLEKILPKDKSLEILEINCGTGEDALYLARKGHHIIATDASGVMVNKAIKKGSNENNSGRNISFAVCSFDNLKEKYSNKKFDLVFSNFGGLNCINEAELKKLSADLFCLLKPGGKFVAVIMGRMCLWELFYFTIKLNFKKAFRRFSKKGLETKLGMQSQETFYYSPSEFKKLFRSKFHLVLKKPVGIALPPSYLEPFFNNKILLLKILFFSEKLFSFSFFSDFADHYFIVAMKRHP